MQQMAGGGWLLVVGAGVVFALVVWVLVSALGPLDRCASCPHRHLWHRWQRCFLCVCPGWSRPLGPTTLPSNAQQP